MVPVVLKEGQNGEYEVEMDTSNSGNTNNAIEIIIEDDSDTASMDNNIEDIKKDNSKKEGHHHHHLTNLHHTIYDGWTRMTPHELSNWIDK